MVIDGIKAELHEVRHLALRFRIPIEVVEDMSNQYFFERHFCEFFVADSF